MDEVLECLALEPGQIVVDGTVGAGGHSRELVRRIGPDGVLIGLDRDSMMLQLAAQTLTHANCHLYHASYAELRAVLQQHEEATGRSIRHVDRIFLDLGLSSDQLADERRGFSFDASGPLDLRFDTSRGEPAWQLLARTNQRELERILRQYGEERFSRQIASRLIDRQRSEPVRTANDLVSVVDEAVPARFRRTARRRPSTRVFQALRIAVNGELEHLEQALQQDIYTCLAHGGRAVVIAFHSLEDRIVKQALRDDQRWSRLHKKPIQASPAEMRQNPRSRSAKLRAAVKT